MTPEQPSRTALATAFLRALHLAIDDAPPVHDDPLAARFLPPAQRAVLKRLATLPPAWREVYRTRSNPFTAMRSQIVVRARYAEDALAAARRRGATRYIVLAAGLDTFAIRAASAGGALPVTEVDHPATQGWKRQLLADAGITAPAGLTLLAVDFEHDDLTAQLGHTEAPWFVSWLGATYYLTRPAITSTLRALAACSAPGSELVFDYWREPPVLDPSTPLLWSTRIATALVREPMRSFFKPGDMEALAAECGWQVREHCAPVIQDARYLAGRSDGLAVPGFAFLLHLERTAEPPST
jgi:methyltransferase (TIGR00027 family)